MIDPVQHKAKNRVPTAAEANDPSWVLFWDMSSGGSTKLAPFEKIYVQLPNGVGLAAAFQTLFGRDPDNVTCDCCGNDYSYGQRDTLYQHTGFHRNCDFAGNMYHERGRSEAAVSNKLMLNLPPFIPLDTYVQQQDVLLVFIDELPRDLVC